MKLFIESADTEKIKEAWNWAILDGVIVSSALVAQTGRKTAELCSEICGIVDGPVCVETVALTAKEIASEARALAHIHRNVVVKVPISKEALKAVKRLEAEGVVTDVSVTLSPLQALLAAKAGASYVSPLVSRLDETDHPAIEAVRQIKTIYQNYGFHTQILASGAQHPVRVLEAALAGADGCTMSFEVLDQLYQHLVTAAGAVTPSKAAPVAAKSSSGASHGAKP